MAIPVFAVLMAVPEMMVARLVLARTVSPVAQDLLDPLVRMEIPDKMAHLAIPADLVAPDQEAIMDALELPAPQVQMACQAVKVFLDPVVEEDSPVLLDHPAGDRVSLARLDSPVETDWMDVKEVPALKDPPDHKDRLAAQVCPGPLANLVNPHNKLDREAVPDLMVNLVEMVKMDSQAALAHKVNQAVLVKMVALEALVLPVKMVSLAAPVAMVDLAAQAPMEFQAFLGPPVVPAKMASLEVQAEMEDPDFLGHKDSQGHQALQVREVHKEHSEVALVLLDSLVGQALMASQVLTEDPVRKDIQDLKDLAAHLDGMVALDFLVNLAALDLKAHPATLEPQGNPILQVEAAIHQAVVAIPLAEVALVDHLLGNPLPNLSRVHLVISFLIAYLPLLLQFSSKRRKYCNIALKKALKSNVSSVSWYFTKINNISSIDHIFPAVTILHLH